VRIPGPGEFIPDATGSGIGCVGVAIIALLVFAVVSDEWKRPQRDRQKKEQIESRRLSAMSVQRADQQSCSAPSGEVLRLDPDGQDSFVGDVYHREGAPTAETISFGGWGDHYFAYLRFPTPRRRDTGYQVAILCLFATVTAPNDARLLVGVVKEPWDGKTLTLSSLPSHDVIGRFGPVVRGWNALDITRLVEGWATGEIPNHGIALVPRNNSHTNGAFASAEARNSQVRPRLILR
jgi:hypothetical protein